jgi:hypothetical protein
MTTPKLKSNLTTVDTLTPDPHNRRRHTPRNLEMIGASLRDVGAARSIVIDEDNEVLAGNGVLEAASGAGISKVQIVDAEGDTIIAVRRRGLTDVQKRALAIFDNRTAELAEWNTDQLDSDQKAGLDLRPFWTPEELDALASNAATDAVLGIAADPGDDAADKDAPVTTGDFQTFSCPLTVDQERIVRAALRTARRVYSVTTAGDALTKALEAWVAAQEVGA